MDRAKRRKQYFAITNVLTSAEKELVAYYEIEWMLKNRVPTIEQVTQQLKKKHPKATQVSVNYYLQRAPVMKALNSRGIPWQEHSQNELTATQVGAAVTVMNLMDERPLTDKLDQLGIAPATYYAWLKIPQFKNMVQNLADQNLTHIRPHAIAEFTKKINQGDWNAIKYWLDTTGELSNGNAPRSEVLLKMIVEIVQKHVQDPQIIMAIANDIRLAAASRPLDSTPEQPAITGEVVEDPELERAKKMIGFG